MATGEVFQFVLGALAVWRVTHLIAYEDGPAEILVRIRRRLGFGFWGSLADCFNCLSIWIAAPVAFIFKPSPIQFVLLWLALSGAACLLERFAPDRISIQPLESPAPESNHVVLRKEQGRVAERAGIDHADTSA